MSEQFTTTLTVNTPLGSISGSGTETADGVAYINATLTVANDVQYDIAFKYTQLKSFIAKSSVACTLEFNNSGTGVPTITLVAGEPFQWRDGDLFANPFTADVTKVYISSATVGTIEIAALHDPTV